METETEMESIEEGRRGEEGRKREMRGEGGRVREKCEAYGPQVKFVASPPLVIKRNIL